MGGYPNSYTVNVSGPSGSALVAKSVTPDSTSCASSTRIACYATTITTIHTDHLGSTSVVTNNSGTMEELLDYAPYGSERLSWSATSESGESDSLKTFIGEYSDRESGLSYLNARYYDAGRGGFVSQDAVFVGLGADDKLLALLLVSPQAQNSYSYGANNPIINKDPSGNCFSNLCLEKEQL